MNIVVLLKQTFDTEAKIQLTGDGKLNGQGVNRVVNPYCEFAVEKALQIVEAAGSGEVIVLSAGGEGTDATIRQALAMGAHRGFWVDDPALAGGDEAATARVLAAALGKIDYDIIFAGFQSVDDTTAQVPSRLSVLLGVPVVTVATDIEVGDGQALVTKEIDDGVEMIDIPLPAIITAQQGLAEPRYPSMRGIMQAKKKPLEAWSLADLGLSPGEFGAAAAKVRCVEFTLPQPRQGGRVIEGNPGDAARELVRLLRDEAKVI